MNTNNITITKDLDTAATKLNEHLKGFNNAYQVVLKIPPWLTPEAENAHRDMKRKLMAARRSNNPTFWDNLRMSNKTYNKLHTKNKRNEWCKFCADTESAKESARMSKILKNCNYKKAQLDSVYKPDGTLTETPDETLEIMEKSHFKDGDTPAHTNTNTSPDKHLSQIIYNESRMQKAISSFDLLKAAGPKTL